MEKEKNEGSKSTGEDAGGALGGGGRKSYKWIFDNMGVKICSAIMAVAIWAIIINIDDPYRSRSFYVNVETINENALKSVNKVYEVIDGDTALVNVRGKKSIVDRLKTTDIKATADLSCLSAVNAVAIQPSLKKTVSSDVTLTCQQVLKVSLEDRESKQVKVTVAANGDPGDGYTLGECTAKPNMIEVSGGESAIKQIASVKVFLNVNGATENFSKRLMPAAYDEDDNEVQSGTLSFSKSYVKVFAQILEDKSVPVKVKVKGKPAEGYQYVGTDILPEEVEIAGTSKKLSGISEVVIPVDISGISNTSPRLEQDIYISDVLPAGVTPVEPEESVSIRINVEPIVKKEISVDVSELTFSSLADGFYTEVVGNTRVVKLVVLGLSSVLNELNEDSINAYINCKGLDEGTYTLPVLIENLDERCRLKESAKLKIRILKAKKSDVKKGDSAGTPPPAPSPAASTQAAE